VAAAAARLQLRRGALREAEAHAARAASLPGAELQVLWLHVRVVLGARCCLPLPLCSYGSLSDF
jgi:hypothetical protein